MKVPGVLAGAIACSCGLIPLAFILTGSAALFRAYGLGRIIMPLELPVVILSAFILVGAIVLSLRRQKCCNLKGLKQNKAAIALNLIVYAASLVFFYLSLRPYVMSRLMG